MFHNRSILLFGSCQLGFFWRDVMGLCVQVSSRPTSYLITTFVLNWRSTYFKAVLYDGDSSEGLRRYRNGELPSDYPDLDFLKSFRQIFWRSYNGPLPSLFSKKLWNYLNHTFHTFSPNLECAIRVDSRWHTSL